MPFADAIERYMAEMPEPKLELIDGQLIVGNGLIGSRRLLWEILKGYGTRAALAMAPLPLWREALCQGFAGYQTPGKKSTWETWRAWVKTVQHQPHIAPAGPHVDGRHRITRESLHFGLSRTADMGSFGQVFGRDLVMRIGEHAFTPDVFLLGRQRAALMKYRYCNGPADLVIEVFSPGHEPQDREVKRRLYEAGRVPEYWLIDPRNQTIEFLRLTGGGYQVRTPTSDGRYRSPWIPGLAFVPAQLWAYLAAPTARGMLGEGLFELEQAQPHMDLMKSTPEGIQWAAQPFAPQVQLGPAPIRFDEFAAWCPEAKFESDGRKITVGGTNGTRNVLGLLLRTMGMVEAVQLLHPRWWLRGLAREEKAQGRDAGRKSRWWQLARRLAACLREKHGWGRIAVIGDLTNSAPLHYWSELLLVSLDPLAKSTWDCYRALGRITKKVKLDLLEADRLTGEEQYALDTSGKEI